MSIKTDLLKRGCLAIEDRINKALSDAEAQIITIVKECGGVLKTLPEYGKATPYAFFEDYFSGRRTTERILGIRYDEENGISLCTESMLDNYMYDTGYAFESYSDFEGKDAEEIHKVLDDASYYMSIDDDNIVWAATIRYLIGCIGDYLD